VVHIEHYLGQEKLDAVFDKSKHERII
jgi:hypothetical protein